MTDYKPLLMKLGTAEDGSDYRLDLSETNGLLIGGRTGSGKTILMYNIISELIKKFSPSECKFCIIDMAGVDYTPWNGAPHFKQPIISFDYEDALDCIVWHCNEVLKRQSRIALKSLDYIQQSNGQTDKKMPYCILMIDEFDYFLRLCENNKTGLDFFYNCIETMTTLGPAVGIYLVMGTQRVGAETITERISSAFDTHVTFNTPSIEHSKIIIGLPGAEELAAYGEAMINKEGQRLDKVKVDYLPADKVVEFVKQLNNA